jgi:hypothetical protein
VFVSVGHFLPNLIFAHKARSLPLEVLKTDTRLRSKGGLLALPANIRLGLKLLAVTNALAYFDMAIIIDVKLFIVQDLQNPLPGACFIKLFTAVINSVTL